MEIAVTPRIADAVGLGIVVCLGLWVAVVAGANAGRTGPVLWLLASLTTAVVLGRILARRPGLLARMVAVAVAGAVAMTWPGMLEAAGPPVGYANANATLAALGVVAALGAARASTAPPDRRGWLGVAGVLIAAAMATGSVAGLLSLLTAFALLALTALARWPGIAIVGGLVVVSLALGVTTAIALGGDPAGLSGQAGVRADLWSAAAEFVDDEPLRGIGPGDFAEQNPVTRDADLRWAHHGYLQVAAETGLVGLALVLGLSAWVWARLWMVSEFAAAPASLAAAAAVIVGLHATVDYVWHFPPVLLVLALMIGEATAAHPRIGEATAAHPRTVPGPRFHD